MYADDIVLYNTVENNMNAMRLDVAREVEWCKANKLTMNINKTKYQLFPRSNQVNMDTLSPNCILKIDQETLQEVKLYKYLGVEIDQLLTMKQHGNNLIKLGSHKLYMLRHVRKMITMQAAVQIFKSVFLEILDYGSIFLSLIREESKEDLQILQTNALRCCFNIIDPRDANFIALHENVGVQTFRHRLISNLLLYIRNAINEGTLTTRHTAARTRGNDGRTINLTVPRTKYIRKTPFYWGSMIWNSLPLDIRETPSKNVFKIYINGALQDNTIRLIFPQQLKEHITTPVINCVVVIYQIVIPRGGTFHSIIIIPV